MAKTITQRVVFKNIAATVLYNTYINAEEHSKAIGAPVKIRDKEGALFTADGNYIRGKNLQLLKDKLIVQSWRASDWKNTDPDSTFILLFEQEGKDGVIKMVHANVPDKEFEGIRKGWNEFYWRPWKKYFRENERSITGEKKR